MKKTVILLTSIFISYLSFGQEIKGNYAIKNVQTGMLLRVKDAHSKNGTPLVLYNPENWKCMTWNFKHVDGNTYQLQNLLTGKTFQPKGNNLEEQPLAANNATQEYIFEPADKGSYMIRQKGTDLYITADAGGEVNSSITLSQKTNSKNQRWTIYEQAPTM